jgi:hypothetical protein
MDQIITAAGLDDQKDEIIDTFCSVFGKLPLANSEDYMNMIRAFRSFIESSAFMRN